MEEPALPELTTDVARKPNWRAAPMAVADVRSFTVPVGFEPSNLTTRRRTPSRFPRRGQSRSGVCPSPSGTHDGQHRCIAPETPAREDREAAPLEPVRVVEQLEQPGALGAIESVAEG